MIVTYLFKPQPIETYLYMTTRCEYCSYVVLTTLNYAESLYICTYVCNFFFIIQYDYVHGIDVVQFIQLHSGMKTEIFLSSDVNMTITTPAGMYLSFLFLQLQSFLLYASFSIQCRW